MIQLDTTRPHSFLQILAWVTVVTTFLGVIFAVACEYGDAPSGSRSVSGVYEMTVQEDLDTCDIEVGAIASGFVKFKATGFDYYQITIVDQEGVCKEWAMMRSGEKLRSSGNRTETSGGCSTRDSFRTELIWSDDNSFEGTETHHLVYVEGECALELPCDWNLRMTGTRCSDCWPSCSVGPVRTEGAMSGHSIEVE